MSDTVLDMDFGELVDLDGTVATPDIPAGGDDDENQPSKEQELEQELLDVDLNKEGFTEETTDGEEEEEEEDEDEHSEKESGSPDSSVKKKKEDTKDASGVPFTLVFARFQLEQGNLSDLNEEELQKVIKEEGEAGAMAYLFEKEIETNRQEILSQYEEDAKELREYIEMKDAGVNTDTARELIADKVSLEKITKEDLEDDSKEDLRRAILTKNYKLTTNFTDAKIKKLVDNHVSLGEDIEESVEALEEIKKANKQQIELEKKRVAEQAAQYQEDNKKALEKVKSTIESLEEIVPGQKLTKQAKTKLQEMITKPVTQDKLGNPINAIWQKRLADPLNFDIKLAYFIQSGLFDGKMDKLVKTSKTAAISDLEHQIASQSKSGVFKANPRTKYEDEDPAVTKNIDSMRGLV
jgi:hypothetical protein